MGQVLSKIKKKMTSVQVLFNFIFLSLNVCLNSKKLHQLMFERFLASILTDFCVVVILIVCSSFWYFLV